MRNSNALTSAERVFYSNYKDLYHILVLLLQFAYLLYLTET